MLNPDPEIQKWQALQNEQLSSQELINQVIELSKFLIAKEEQLCVLEKKDIQNSQLYEQELSLLKVQEQIYKKIAQNKKVKALLQDAKSGSKAKTSKSLNSNI